MNGRAARFVLPAKLAEIMGTMLKHRASVRCAWALGSFALAEGAATYIMGVPKELALAGAHFNNLNTNDYEWDSIDDQWSIQLGRYYAKKMGWKTIYGGRNSIFRD